MRLRQLERRYADLALQRAPQVTLAHAEVSREIGNVAPIQRARRNPLRRQLRQPGHGIELRLGPAGRQFGTAAQTGPESSALGGRRRIEEAAVPVVRQPRLARRPAVDVRRRDPDEEHAVEARIARVHRELIGVAVDRLDGFGFSSRDHNETWLRSPCLERPARRIRASLKTRALAEPAFQRTGVAMNGARGASRARRVDRRRRPHRECSRRRRRRRGLAARTRCDAWTPPVWGFFTIPKEPWVCAPYPDAEIYGFTAASRELSAGRRCQ